METIKPVVQGFRPPEPKEKDFIFGGLGQVPSPIIMPDSDWSSFTPQEEFQLRQNFETFSCVTFTILNALEILAKVQFGENWNLAERYTYIASETNPEDRGNDPRKVADSVRKLGTIAEKDLAFDELIDSLEKFNSPKPLTKELLKKGQEFLNDYVFRFDILPRTGGKISQETLKEGLKRSPLLIALFAWANRENGTYFRPEGGEDIHATLLVKEGQVFDSYSPARKTLEANFPLYYAMRFFIRKKTEAEKEAERANLSLFVKILQGVLNFLKSLLAQKSKPLPPSPVIDNVPIEIKEEPRVSRIPNWSKGIEHAEGYGTPIAITITKNLNPGAIKNKSGEFLKFNSYEEGLLYLQNYLRRACEGNHAAYIKGGETTLFEFTRIYVGPNDYNYCGEVAGRLGVSTSIKIKELL